MNIYMVVSYWLIARGENRSYLHTRTYNLAYVRSKPDLFFLIREGYSSIGHMFLLMLFLQSVGTYTEDTAIK